MILSIENLTKTYGEKILFKNINIGIDEGDKIGIVGVNGTGKSTFIKAIAGLTPVDSGTFIKMRGLRIEYLAQDSEINPDNTVLAEVFRGSQPIMQALRGYELAIENNRRLPLDKTYQQDIMKYSQQIDQLDGWQLESEAKAVLTQLGITDFSRLAGSLSGGQKKRLALAAALVQPADLLILDEPTNHLDSETIGWLEEYLHKLKGALLIVTHDRYFLDAVATRIFELDKGQAYSYTGNYTQFLELKAAREERGEAMERKRQNLLRTELAWMRRGAQARSTKQKARIERFENLRDQKYVASNEKVEIGLKGSRLGRTVIEVENLTYQMPGKVIVDDFSYVLLRNDRVGIIGANGSGKTTLLNLLAGKILPTNGNINIGQTVKIGYFTQECVSMDERLRVIEYIKEAAHFITLADGTRLSASQLLELFLFTGEMQWTPLAKLSGGEKRRLYLLRILMESPNVLFLDEPTNDLDLQTMSILEDFIDNFQGAIVIVSHDRYFLDRLVDKVFAYEGPGKLRQYPGGYTDYWINRERELAAEIETIKSEKIIATQPNQQIATKQKPITKVKMSFKEEREYSEIEAQIAAIEGELKVTRLQMQQAGADFELLGDLSKSEAQLVEELNYKMERWAYLEELAESLKDIKDK